MVNAYIPNTGSNTVSVIDAAIDLVAKTIVVGSSPNSVSVSPDGTKVYVCNANASSNSISVIDTSTNTVTATITGFSSPDGVAFTPDGSRAYVPNGGTGAMAVIDTSTNSITATINGFAFSGFSGVAVTPDGTEVYVVNSANSVVSVIDVSTNTISATITVGGPSDAYIGLAISPDGTQAYVTNYAGSSGTNVAVIDISTNTVSATITVNEGPIGVVFTPDGAKAYVANNGNNNVSVIDVSTHTVSTSIPVGSEPEGIAVTSDGSKVYVANAGSNTVSVISVATDSVIDTIPVGIVPTAFGQFIQPGSIPVISYTAPQGRLTLTSGAPVMTADATAKTNVYYTPYVGNNTPIYDGANMQSYTFGELTMTLNSSNQTSGHLYDLFVFLNSAVVTIGAGPAWSSSSSRGTGAGTTELQQIDGLWVNANSITLKNSSTSYSSIPVGQATYVGTAYMTANGQTGISFKPTAAAGGSNNIVGLWNAYNRVPMQSLERDSTGSYTYASTTFRATNGSDSNRVSWVDGLQQTPVSARIKTAMATSNGGCWSVHCREVKRGYRES